MRLLVLGASGATGQWVTRLAAGRGHAVTAAVRPETPYRAPDGVEVVRGSVMKPSFLALLLSAADAVISCLGLRRRSLLPWSTLLSPPDLVERVTRIVVDAPRSRELQRFVWISAGGVGDSVAQTSAPVRLLIGAGHVGTAYRDLEAAERVLAKSSIPSLAVRPVTLMHGRPTGVVGPVSRYGLLSTVRRSDVATWMLDVADGSSSFPGSQVLLGRRR
ncbi:MAG: NAD(P)H-binding protein [Gemmatimonadota bacterium]